MPSTSWNWATQSRFPSFCLLLARPKSREVLLKAYGADPQRAAEMTLAEAHMQALNQGAGTFLRVGTLGDWSFCYENRDLLGITDHVRTAASREGEAIILFKGGDGTNTMERMQNGQRVELFEPHRPADVQGEGPFTLSALVNDQLAADPGILGMSAATQVLTEHYGVEISRESLEGILLTYFSSSTGEH
ncbi:DUF6461 domain-containing protein [Streptomyces sp. NPDC016626]|uniref:DUF6461 domain-containing protein n=1 Tax=Streptomyces sp. NPDC016626 TaxID=3364968 RepID=UPI0036FCC598